MATMTVSEARAALPEVLDRVTAGEQVTITRHGKPVAVVVRPDILWSRGHAEDLFIQAESFHRLLGEARGTALPARHGGLTAERAEEFIKEIRAGRERW